MTDATRCILVVDDDPEVSYLLSVVLDGPDRAILTASTGAVALEVLERQRIDLVVLDLILPDVDGRTLLREIRSRPETASVPVIVVTGRGGAEIRQECFDLGADLFTEKPFDPEKIVGEAAACLERRGTSDRLGQREVAAGIDGAGLFGDPPEDGAPHAVVVVQLDGFVGVSERWGRPRAESILRTVGAVLESGTSPGARIARLGGGEFAIVLEGETATEAASVAERLRERIRALDFDGPDGETLALTVSIGVVDGVPGAPLEEGLDEARRRIFQATAAGGDRVVASDPEAGPAVPRVLVAEDDEISAAILVHRLEREGLEVVMHDNGRAAFQAALEETPNLVILDVKMPGMDGFEVLERLRSTPEYRSVPIVMLTSMGSEADVVRGFQLGADDYVLKPFSPVELSARVWRLLRRGRSPSAV